MEIWELVARESIRDLVARYNANLDAGRFDAVVELFAPDATMEVHEEQFTGHDGIRTMFAASTARFSGSPRPGAFRHFTSTLQIDVVSEHSASSRCYFEAIVGNGLDHWGRYLDEYCVVESRWRFVARRILVDANTPGGWSHTLAAASG